MTPELTNQLVAAAIIAQAASHILLMLKVYGQHDGEIFRLFDRLKMKRKG